MASNRNKKRQNKRPPASWFAFLYEETGEDEGDKEETQASFTSMKTHVC